MPIPQLSRKTRSDQSWRNNKRRHYLSLKKSKLVRNPKRNLNYGKRGLKDMLPDIPREKLLKYGSFAILGLIIFIFLSFVWISRGLPSPNQLIERQVAQSTTIYDRTGEHILYQIHGEEKRTLVSLEDIPEDLKWATISVEDKNFYEHGGFSLWAIFRTAVTNVLFGRKAGGSTLTQQFIKNSVLTTEKTYTRKIKELILSYQVEKKFSKDEILQMYFNEIPYGSNAYGVEAASQKYFGKSVKEINLAEAAVLAALPQAPSRYSPYGSNKNLLLERQKYILDLMVKYGYADKDEVVIAKGLEINFKEPTDNIIAPHFVMMVKEALGEKYGEKVVEQGGLKIYTTLDLYKQEAAEEVIKKWGERNAAEYGATNASLVSIDPKTGQVLALVGSRDYFNDEIDGQVNITTSLRQPGSSMKPIIYATGFVRGYTPDTILYDVVTNFSNDAAKPYEPHNYDSKEHGPVTVRKALAGSLNIPAVKMIYLAGINNVLDLAEEMGYTSLGDRDRFGLSLVLGGGEVKLLEHTNAYSVFAREGKVRPISMVLKVEDRDGKVIEEFKEEKERKVMEPEITRLVNDILSDNSARSYVFGESNYLTLGSRPVGAKTGTTNDYRDAWTIGYTPSIVTGVWVGNNNNSEMKRGADGSVVAAPIWHDYMQKVLGDTPIESFNKPEPIKTGKPVLDGNIEGKIKVKIDRASGLLATEYTPESFIEEKSFQEAHSILYYINKDDPRGEAPKNPAEDPQFDLWEKPIKAWAEKEKIESTPPPTEYDNLHKPENQPKLTINSPAKNEAITTATLKSTVNVSAPRGVNRAEYYIDDALIFVNYSFPFNLEKDVSFLSNGFHSLLVKACDDIDNCSSSAREFNLILTSSAKQGDIGVSWKSPASSLAVNNTDFPLALKINITNPAQTAKAAIYYEPEGGGDRQEIATIMPINTAIAETNWKNPPLTGTYKVYAETRGWGGQSAKSNQITISINNVEK